MAIHMIYKIMWAFTDGGLRKRIGIYTNLRIYASINSLVTYKLKGLGTFYLYTQI